MNWKKPESNLVLENKFIRISSVDPDSDLEELYNAASLHNNGEDLFKFHVNVPEMKNRETFKDYLNKKNNLPTEILYKIYSKRLNRNVGCFSLMNINMQHGTIEIGSIWISKEAQRSEINTNTMLLMITYIFEVCAFLRLEWKCNNLNENSKRAAKRLGFEYEGLFRNHMISRNENRDTAWFSIIDSEWNEKKKNINLKADLA
jgi:RimJ/RimL family protein N-acetyltransferase